MLGMLVPAFLQPLYLELKLVCLFLPSGVCGQIAPTKEQFPEGCSAQRDKATAALVSQ